MAKTQTIHRIFVIDDDVTAVSELEKAIASRYNEFEVCGSAKDAETGQKKIFDTRPDILFLDVELPGMSGVQFHNSIKDAVTWPMYVVFYSCYQKYIIDALREAAFDYLLKPFSQEELNGILNRYLNAVSTVETRTTRRPATDCPLNNNFLVTTVTGYRMIRIEEIGYFIHESAKKQWRAHLVSQNSICLKRGTSAGDILNYSPAFVQVSQSAIININYLALISGHECKLCPPFDKAENMTISRKYLKRLQETLNFI